MNGFARCLRRSPAQLFLTLVGALGIVAAATPRQAVSPAHRSAPMSSESAPPAGRENGLSFSLRFREEVSSYSVLGVYVLPSEELRLAVEGGRGEFTIAPGAGEIVAAGERWWVWRAPAEAGLYPLRLADRGSGEAMTLNVFVLVPFERIRGEELSGYRIGSYPRIPLRQLPIYRPPTGFVEATLENVDTPLSPHFTLGQFLCKQGGGFPKFLVLRERLLLKLELILEELNRRGYRAGGLHIMSGYRTPFYNHAIGNVRYSRHIYGDAADIFVDELPADGMMDDLNGDGVVDLTDVDILRDVVEKMAGKPWYQPFVGGLGRYRRNSVRGPFVHVDTRGFRARWEG